MDEFSSLLILQLDESGDSAQQQPLQLKQIDTVVRVGSCGDVAVDFLHANAAVTAERCIRHVGDFEWAEPVGRRTRWIPVGRR